MIALLASLLVLANPAERDTSIRKTDWKQYFLSDTSTYSARLITDEFRTGELEVSLKGEPEESWFGSYPEIDDVSFGDLDGDGIEEAEIAFFTGGTAGSCSFAVLQKTAAGIKTAHIGYGYKLHTQIVHDTLKGYYPIPTDYDPNCCQQSMSEEHYRLSHGQLVLVDSLAYGIVGNAQIAVREFYRMLEDKDYDAAYSLLSAKYQVKHPYREWKKGFSTTQTTSVLDEDISYPSEADTTVTVRLTSVDLIKGKLVSSTYSGTWKLIWYGLDRGWLLDEPKIRKVK